jgi:hypothetical protein
MGNEDHQEPVGHPALLDKPGQLAGHIHKLRPVLRANMDLLVAHPKLLWFYGEVIEWIPNFLF